MKNFSSVSTNAARFQDISLNPQKLAGMCAKLKCCLNYEVDDYMEASRKLPPKDAVLQTQDCDYFLFKTDILAGLCTYSSDKNLAANVETISASRAKEIIAMNRQGEKPLSLQEDNKAKEAKKPIDLLADADLSRFDKSKRKRKTLPRPTKTSQTTAKRQLTHKTGRNGRRDNLQKRNALTTSKDGATNPTATISPTEETQRTRRTPNSNRNRQTERQ